MTEELAATGTTTTAAAGSESSSTVVAETQGAAVGDSNSFSLPDAYKDKPWASKIKSSDDLWKQVDNLQGVVGKKNAVPDFTTATPKEVEDFYGQLRPADKAEYAKALQFEDGLSDTDKQFYTDLMHETGARPEVANAVIKKFQAGLEAQKAELFSDKGFQEELKKSFGDDYKTIAGDVAKNIKANLNAEDQKAIDEIPNRYMGVMYRYAQKMIESYGAKETGTAASAAAGTPSNNVDAEIKTIRGDIAKLSQQSHTQAQKTALMNKLTEAYKRKVS